MTEENRVDIEEHTANVARELADSMRKSHGSEGRDSRLVEVVNLASEEPDPVPVSRFSVVIGCPDLLKILRHFKDAMDPWIPDKPLKLSGQGLSSLQMIEHGSVLISAETLIDTDSIKLIFQR